MKRIAMIGLYTIPNMGDKILCETSAYLAKNLRDDIEILEIDVCPRYKVDYKGLEYVKYRLARLMIVLGGKFFKYENQSILRYNYEYFMWWIRLNRYYHRKLKSVDAIVFAGGGFLKFRTQGLNYYVEQIVKIAKKKNIPVMMNGVGIEGYSDDDIRCQKLKKIINSDCVKVITTRDDIDTLKQKYVCNEHIKCARVGDPALWIPECYGAHRQKSPDTVGVNVIRGMIYKDYGNHFSYGQLKQFYKDLLDELTGRGIKWTLFSNGMKSDQEFGVELLREMDLPLKDHLLPAPVESIDLINMVGDFSCILGTRLHACITAYALDVPVVGLIWNEKMRMFSDIIGKENNFFEEDQLEVKGIADCLARSIGETYDTSIRDRLKKSTKEYLDLFLSEQL